MRFLVLDASDGVENVFDLSGISDSDGDEVVDACGMLGECFGCNKDIDLCFGMDDGDGEMLSRVVLPHDSHL